LVATPWSPSPAGVRTGGCIRVQLAKFAPGQPFSRSGTNLCCSSLVVTVTGSLVVLPEALSPSKQNVLAVGPPAHFTYVELDVDQASFCRRRRASAIKPPQAATKPGSPAPAIGPGTRTLASTAPVIPVVPLIMSTAKNWPAAFCSKLAAVKPAADTVKSSGPFWGLLPPFPHAVQLTPYSKKPVPST